MKLVAHVGALVAAALAVTLPGSASAGSWELRVCADADFLPFSNRAGEGFDNRIAKILADAMDADLTYTWLPDRTGRTRQRFVQGAACDVLMGVLESQPGYLTSYPYYRTGYVFLQRAGAPFRVATLDDPALRDLRIGVQGGTAKLIPPGLALANRGVVQNQQHFIDLKPGERGTAPVLQALLDDRIDVAIVWGAVAGPFAKAHPEIALTPVSPEIDIPFIPMVGALAIGVRPGDEALRDDLDVALAQTWEATRAVLVEAGVPLIDVPQPTPSVAGGG